MLTSELQETLRRSIDMALDRRHEFLILEHLLLSMLDDPRALEILDASGVDTNRLREELEAYLSESVSPLPELSLIHI